MGVAPLFEPSLLELLPLLLVLLPPPAPDVDDEDTIPVVPA